MSPTWLLFDFGTLWDRQNIGNRRNLILAWLIIILYLHIFFYLFFPHAYFTYCICLGTFLNGAVYKTDADFGGPEKHKEGHMDFIQLSTKFNIWISWILIPVLLVPCNITQGKKILIPLGLQYTLIKNGKHLNINCMHSI